jgi:hypothetical protein
VGVILGAALKLGAGVGDSIAGEYTSVRHGTCLLWPRLREIRPSAEASYVVNSCIVSYWLSLVNLFPDRIALNGGTNLAMRDKDILELEQWLTPTEAGRIIGISRQAAIKRLQTGKLRGTKTHQGWLVDPKDLIPKNR